MLCLFASLKFNAAVGGFPGLFFQNIFLDLSNIFCVVVVTNSFSKWTLQRKLVNVHFGRPFIAL